MATGPSSTGNKSPHNRVWKWTGITNGGSPDTMSPVWVDALDDVTVYVFGTLGGNTPAIAIEGSPVNTGTPTSNEFAPLTTGGVAISLNAVKTCAVIDQSTLWVKPVLTGGDGSTDLTVWVVAK